MAVDLQTSTHTDEYPLTVREAAKYLGVSPQTVYLWVERKADSPSPRNGSQYPVSKIGSRTVPRFVQKGDGVSRPVEHDGVVYQRERVEVLVDALPGTGRRPPERINLHGRLAGSSEETQRTA